jgi:hypothetical protein
MARIQDYEFGQAPSAMIEAPPMLQNQTAGALSNAGGVIQQSARSISDTVTQQEIAEGFVAGKELESTTEEYFNIQDKPFIKGEDSRDSLLSTFRRKANDIKAKATSARALQQLETSLEQTESKLWAHAKAVDRKLSFASLQESGKKLKAMYTTQVYNNPSAFDTKDLEEYKNKLTSFPGWERLNDAERSEMTRLAELEIYESQIDGYIFNEGIKNDSSIGPQKAMALLDSGLYKFGAQKTDELKRKAQTALGIVKNNVDIKVEKNEELKKREAAQFARLISAHPDGTIREEDVNSAAAAMLDPITKSQVIEHAKKTQDTIVRLSMTGDLAATDPILLDKELNKYVKVRRNKEISEKMAQSVAVKKVFTIKDFLKASDSFLKRAGIPIEDIRRGYIDANGKPLSPQRIAEIDGTLNRLDLKVHDEQHAVEFIDNINAVRAMSNRVGGEPLLREYTNYISQPENIPVREKWGPLQVLRGQQAASFLTEQMVLKQASIGGDPTDPKTRVAMIAELDRSNPESIISKADKIFKGTLQDIVQDKIEEYKMQEGTRNSVMRNAPTVDEGDVDVTAPSDTAQDMQKTADAVQAAIDDGSIVTPAGQTTPAAAQKIVPTEKVKTRVQSLMNSIPVSTPGRSPNAVVETNQKQITNTIENNFTHNQNVLNNAITTSLSDENLKSPPAEVMKHAKAAASVLSQIPNLVDTDEALNHPAIKQYIGRQLSKFNSADKTFDEAEVLGVANAVIKGVNAAAKRQIKIESDTMEAKWFVGQDTRRKPGETISAWETRMSSEFIDRVVKTRQDFNDAIVGAFFPTPARAGEIAEKLNARYSKMYKPAEKTEEELLESYMRGN